MADSGTPKPPPYDGHACTKRDHVVSGVKIDPSDERLWKCDCGCTMIGNARVEIRFGLLPHRFPEAEFKCGKSESAARVPRFEAIRRALTIGRELEAENKQLRDTLAEIKANAEAWHGSASSTNRHARALRVIAGWCEEALR